MDKPTEKFSKKVPLINDYLTLLDDLKKKIREARLKAAFSVNHALLKIYWEIGSTISHQQDARGWGGKTVDTLSRDLRSEFTDMKGLSPRNLRYMRDFAVAYPHFPFLQEPLAKFTDDSIWQAPLAKLPWYHHITLLGKVKDPATRLFYIQQTIQNGWSRNVLVLQIESDLYKRQGKAINNFSQTLPAHDSDLAVQTFKSPYILEFLTLNDAAKERDIERGLTEHLKKFMLELGKGFAYVGNQYNLKVEGDDYFLDLLFYNYHLHCFVIFELKIGEFKPEYSGKLNFYINTINEEIKTAEDKPTIGILLCKTPNETVVKYSLQGIETPMGVADYKIAKALPKEFKSDIPSIKELERALDSKAENLQKPVDQKLEKIKQALGKLGNEEAKIKLSKDITIEVAEKVFIPFTAILDEQLIEIKNLFSTWSCNIYMDSVGRGITHGMEKHIAKLIKEYDREFNKLLLSFRFEGLKKAGVKAFDCYLDVEVQLQPFKYSFKIKDKILLEKLYHQSCTSEELQMVAERYTEDLLDQLSQQLQQLKN